MQNIHVTTQSSARARSLQRPRNLAAVKPQAPRFRRNNACRSYTKATPGKTKLGFVGIGIMGLPMATNLINAGYELTVWNRSAEKLAPLLELGATAAETPAQVASQTDYTFAMLSGALDASAIHNNEAAQEVVTGAAGILEGIRGKGYVDMSTLSEVTAVDIAYEVTQAGGAFLEAPVSGSKGPAEQGQLIFLTSGDASLYDAVSGPLDIMGKAKFFLGDPGSGARMKLVLNMVMGSMMVSLSEGLVLAQQTGLDPKEVIEALGLGAMACPMFALKGPAMVDGNYPTAFPYKHQLKDLKYALEMAEDSDLKLSVAEAAAAVYERESAEHADKDFSAVMESVKSCQ